MDWLMDGWMDGCNGVCVCEFFGNGVCLIQLKGRDLNRLLQGMYKISK